MTRRDEMLRRLREADPVAGEDLRKAATSRQAQATLDRILEEPRDIGERPRHPRRTWGVLAAASVVLLAGILVAQQLQPERLDDTTARAVLTEAARTAAATPLPALGPGEYLYVRTALVDRVTLWAGDETITALVPRRREVWVAADGSGRIREVPGQPRFLTPQDRAAWEEAGRPSVQGGPSDTVVPAGRLLPGEINALPSDPAALEPILARRFDEPGVPRHVAVFLEAADLLSQPLVEPRVRAALFRVAAGIEGVSLLGEVSDPRGRDGVGVALTTRSRGALERRVLIFDPSTSAVLAEQVVLLRGRTEIDAKFPAAIDSRVYEAAGVVSSPELRPPA